MAKTALVDKAVSDGERVVRKLDEMSTSVKGAFWLLSDDGGGWSLFVATPWVDQVGRINAYKRIGEALKSLGADVDIDLRDVSVVSPNSPLVRLFRSAIKTGEGINGIRFSKNVINGTFIEDAYIYRMN